MRNTSLLRRTAAASTTAILAVTLTATSAFAHATAQNTTASSGGYGYLDLRVPHGCEGAATDTVTVKIPDGVVNVKPERKAGWTVASEIGAITPYESYGEMVTEGTVSVTWTADEGYALPDANFEDFGLSVKWPELAAGTKVYFPTVQTCGDAEEAWIQIPVEGSDAELEKPSPAVTITEAKGGHGAADAKAGDMADAETGDMADAEKGMAVDGSGDRATGTAAIVGLLGGVLAGAVSGFFAGRRK
jgi:uncharacterized protein YcnI